MRHIQELSTIQVFWSSAYGEFFRLLRFGGDMFTVRRSFHMHFMVQG